MQFDYHQHCKKNNQSKADDFVETELNGFLDSNNYFVGNGELELYSQSGIIRTNCLDCLDRTNTMQTIAGAITRFPLSPSLLSLFSPSLERLLMR